jgi:hypothetical protein
MKKPTTYFESVIRSYLIEQEPGDPNQSELPGNPNQSEEDLPPDTEEQDDVGELNLMQLVARAMLYDPSKISDIDKVKLAELGEKGVDQDTKDIALSLINSYLSEELPF